MYGLMLIAVLAIMGGAIAYIGDKLGTKVGKKKLSIFGLRPKHTSIIVTIVTGILIAASTLGVLSLTSRDVRTALFGMEALKTQMVHLSQEVSLKNYELESSRAALEAKSAEYTALTAKVKETADRLSAITDELSLVTAERDRAAAALTTAKKDISTLQATKDELDSRVTALNNAKKSLETDVDRLNELAANLKKGIQVVREGVVVFRAGEVLSTTVVKGGQDKDETAKNLSHAIYETNRFIVDKLGLEKDLEVLWIAKSEYEEAVSLISSTPESVIVRITSAGNTIYGEPTIGRIDLFPNRLVFHEGTSIYSETIDAGKGAKNSEEAVLYFLQKVNNEAIRQGILPDPLQGTVGVMSGSQLFETVNRVNRYQGKVELTAMTTDDTYTSGPLKIYIRVRPLTQ